MLVHKVVINQCSPIKKRQQCANMTCQWQKTHESLEGARREQIVFKGALILSHKSIRPPFTLFMAILVLLFSSSFFIFNFIFFLLILSNLTSKMLPNVFIAITVNWEGNHSTLIRMLYLYQPCLSELGTLLNSILCNWVYWYKTYTYIEWVVVKEVSPDKKQWILQ